MSQNLETSETFKSLLKKHQNQGLDKANFWRNGHLGPIPPDVHNSLSNQIKDQREFFDLPKPDMYVWLVFGGYDDLDSFLDYYSKVLPEKTYLIFLLDKNPPLSIPELKSRLSPIFQQILFLKIPDTSLHSYVKVQLHYFSAIYARLGSNAWNLFVDLDEFLPLPKEYPTFQTFCSMLEEKKILQLTTLMVDAWELQSHGQTDFYFDSLGPDKSKFLTKHLKNNYMMDNVLKDESYFISPEGIRCMLFNFSRNELLGIFSTRMEETGQKVVLIKPKNMSYAYPVSSHEPHFVYSSVKEALVKYPLIHKKFVKKFYTNALASVYSKEKQIKDAGKTSFGWPVEMNWVEETEKLYSSLDGYGPYKLLGDHDDDHFLDLFKDRFLKLSELVDDKLQLSLSDNQFGLKSGDKTMYPFLHLDPLL